MNFPYDLKRVAVTIDGILLTGASDGDFVTISPDGNVHEKTLGARGEVAVSATNNKMGTITLSIFQGARNPRATLDAIIARQEALGLSDATTVEIQVKDLQTGEHIVLPRCWIETEPTRAFGATQQSRDYVFAFDERIVVPLTA